MKSIFTFLVCFMLFAVSAQIISLDPAFGNSGIVITPATTEINHLTIASDGAVFSAGYTSEGGGSGVYRLTVSKHNNDGSVAAAFGTNGLVYTEIAHSEFPNEIRIQPDGKILVAGSVYLGPTPGEPGDYRSFIVRYHPDGTVDSSFAVNGVFLFNYTNSHFNSILLQNNGSMFLVGNAGDQTCVVKLTPNGIPDSNYGSGSGAKFIGDANYFLVNWGGITLSDGNLLLYGYEASDFENTKVSCAKIDTQGNFVSSFGQGGKMVIDTYDSDTIIGTVTELISNAAELPDGKIMLHGYSLTGLLLKLNADGSLDTGFADNGILTHSYPAKGMKMQQDGKILLGGSHELSDYNYGFTITRLNPDGTADPGFNGNGSFTADISPRNDYLQTMDLSGSGDRLTVGGSSRYFSTEANFMLVRIDLSQSLGLSENSTTAVSAYPNPFTDELTLSLNLQEIAGIKLIDAAGRSVASFQSPGNGKLYLPSLADGAYQLFITYRSGETVQIKVMKQ